MSWRALQQTPLVALTFDPFAVCLPAESSELGQRLPDVDAPQQQLKLKERQRFFEEVFQHDVDAYLSSAHLCIRDYKRRERNTNKYTHRHTMVVFLHASEKNKAENERAA